MGYICESSEGPVPTVEIFWDPKAGKNPVSCVIKSVMCLVLKRPNNESGFKMEAL